MQAPNAKPLVQAILQELPVEGSSPASHDRLRRVVVHRHRDCRRRLQLDADCRRRLQLDADRRMRLQLDADVAAGCAVCAGAVVSADSDRNWASSGGSGC